MMVLWSPTFVQQMLHEQGYLSGRDCFRKVEDIVRPRSRVNRGINFADSVCIIGVPIGTLAGIPGLGLENVRGLVGKLCRPCCTIGTFMGRDPRVEKNI